MTAALSSELRDKLVKVCSRLGSEHDGERAAAALLATRLLTGAGLSWDDAISTGASSDMTCLVMDAVRTARTNAATRYDTKPRRTRRTPEQILRAERLALLLAFIGVRQDLLKPHELEQFRTGMSGRFAWNRWSPSDHAMQTADYLASVIRRRMEERV
jgi:hypothetical protein